MKQGMVTKDKSLKVKAGRSFKGWLSSIYSASSSARSEKNDGTVGLFQKVW